MKDNLKMELELESGIFIVKINWCNRIWYVYSGGGNYNEHGIKIGLWRDIIDK